MGDEMSGKGNWKKKKKSYKYHSKKRGALLSFHRGVVRQGSRVERERRPSLGECLIYFVYY